MRINNLARITLVLLLLFETALVALPQEAPRQKPPAGGTPRPFLLPKTETFSLKDGVRVTLVPYGSVPKVTVDVFVRVGDINQAENQVWLDQLTGNLMKLGTATRSAAQVARQAASMGGGLSIDVGADTTTIQGDVLSEFGPQMVALLADVIQHPLLPASEIPRLKSDLVRELTVSKSQSGPIATETFRKALYPNHPYGRYYPTPSMIERYAIEDVKKFYNDNFGASRTHIFVSGQFDAAAMKTAISSGFENWARGSDPYVNIPRPVAARSIILVDRPGASQSTVQIGLPAIDASHPDYIGFLVLDAVLGGSFGSRITSNIREQKGYTYSPFSQLSTRYRDGFWAEVADVTTAVTGASIKEIFFEIDRLRNEPPTQDELQGIKNYLAGIFVLQNSSRQGVIGQLAFADLNGLPQDYLSTYVQKIMAVSPEEVQRLARRYLLPGKMTIVVVGDKAKVADQLSAFGPISSN